MNTLTFHNVETTTIDFLWLCTMHLLIRFMVYGYRIYSGLVYFHTCPVGTDIEFDSMHPFYLQVDFVKTVQILCPGGYTAASYHWITKISEVTVHITPRVSQKRPSRKSKLGLRYWGSKRGKNDSLSLKVCISPSFALFFLDLFVLVSCYRILCINVWFVYAYYYSQL